MYGSAPHARCDKTGLVLIAALIAVHDLWATQEQADKFAAEKEVVGRHCTADSDIHHIDSNSLSFQHPNNLTNRLAKTRAFECLIPCRPYNVAADLFFLECHSNGEQYRELLRALASEKTRLCAGLPLRDGAGGYMLVLRGIRIASMMSNGAVRIFQ